MAAAWSNHMGQNPLSLGFLSVQQEGVAVPFYGFQDNDEPYPGLAAH